MRDIAVGVRQRLLNSLQAWVWLALISLLVCDGAIRALSGDEITSTEYAHDFIFGHPASDSWGPITAAIEHLRAEPRQPLYARLFFLEHTKFQYPVSSVVPFDLVQRATAASWGRIFAQTNAASWIAVWLTGFMTWLLLPAHPAANVNGTTTALRVRRASLELIATLGLTLLFYPLTQSYMLGQVQTFVTALATAALLMWHHRRERTCGVLLGLCCAIKPQWGVALLWALLRRQWRLFWSAAATLSLAIAISVAMYGFVQYPDYFRVLTYITRHGETYFPNQSVNGLMNRLLLNGNPLEWHGDAFAPFHPIVYWSTVLSSAMLLASVLLGRRHLRPTTLDLAVMMLALTMASPVAWEHHYGVLLPMFAIALSAASIDREPALPRAALLVAFLVAAQPLAFTARFATTPLNIVQSNLFAGAALVLMVAARTLSRQQR